MLNKDFNVFGFGWVGLKFSPNHKLFQFGIRSNNWGKIMPTVTKIDEYEVMYSSNLFPPRIWLKGAGKFLGQLIFRPNRATLPADSMASGQVNLNYHLDDFQNVIDLLRNEKPMYLLWTGTGSGNENGIKTTAEPVGEKE
jgi:hypothetical protein